MEDDTFPVCVPVSTFFHVKYSKIIFLKCNLFQAGGDGSVVWDLVALLGDRLARHLERHHHHNQHLKVI